MIEVADTGIGIPLQEQEQLFTRFFRSSLAQEQRDPGQRPGPVDRARDRREARRDDVSGVRAGDGHHVPGAAPALTPAG